MKIFKTLLLSLLIVFCSFSNLYAQEDLQKLRVDLFEKGQDSFSLADVIEASQGTLVQNVVLNRKGQLFKRKGQVPFPHWSEDESNTAFTGLGAFTPDQNTKYLIAASGVKIIRSDNQATGAPGSLGASWTIVNINAPSGQDYDLTAGKDTEFLQCNDLFAVLNGFDETAFYNGSAWDPGSSSTASPPVGTTGAWVLNYLFISGNPTNEDWVYFSNNLDPQTFTQATDIFRVNTGDGQAVIRLEPFKLNEMIIYKEKSTYDLDLTGTTPLDDWTLQPISRSVGTPARRSVVNLGNDHWFLSSEPFAVRSLVRTSFDKLLIDMVSQPVQDYFDGTGSITLNTTQVSKACAILFDNKYILAIPTGTSIVNNTVLVHDFLTKSWYPIDGWFPAAWAIFDEELYYIDALDGRAIKCFTGTKGDVASGPIVTASSEPTVAISWEYRSKNFDFDAPENLKMPDALMVEFEAVGAYDVDIYIEIDDRGWQSVGSLTMDADSVTLPADLPIVLSSAGIATQTFQLEEYGEFKKIKVRFVQDGLNQLVNLHSYTLIARVKPWRREE